MFQLGTNHKFQFPVKIEPVRYIYFHIYYKAELTLKFIDNFSIKLKSIAYFRFVQRNLLVIN